MIANYSKGTPARRGSGALDLGVALLAALAVAFAAFAMPAALLADLVSATGLPNILAAAQPPLGATARLALVAGGAAGTFLLVWLTLRALGRLTRERPAASTDEPGPALPRIRRADAHPDAPARRPVFAGSDLGEPIAAEPADDAPVAELEVPEPEESDTLELDQLAPEEVEEEEAVVAQAPPLPALEAPWSVIEAPKSPVFEAPSRAAFAAQPPAWSVPVKAPPERKESIADLMRRLEGGLRQNGEGEAGGSQDEPRPPVSVAPEPAGHSLRAALNELQKMAGRG